MFQVITLNLNYRVAKHGAWEARRALIVEAVRRVESDLLVLQAVEGSDGASQAAELAALLNYPHLAFAAAMTDGEVSRGSAFVSRRPLENVATRRLTRRGDHDDTSQRVVLRARVQTDAGAIDLYNAHFSWVSEQALENARETLQFRAAGPALLLGDLNSAPDSQVVQDLQRAGLLDMWAALRPEDPGYTFEADRPTQRIDYALATPDVQARVRHIERVGIAGGAPPRLSDHLGLLVTLSEVRSSGVH